MKENKTKRMALVVGGIAVVLLAVMMVFAYKTFAPKATAGNKTIVFEVTDAEGQSEEFTIKTDAEYLSEALLAEELIKGEDSEYGLFVTEVNGIAADMDKQEWWSFTKDGEMTDAVDKTPIADGDHFEATLMVGFN